MRGERGAVVRGTEWSAALRRGSEAELRTWLEFALACCDAADDVGLRYFRHAVEITTKPDRSYVTGADTAIEELIRGRLADAYPDHGILGEEFGEEGAESSVRWYVDPIDATHNFMRGIPIFATLLAVERDGEIQVGVMSAPALGQRWYAWRGGGSWAAVTLRGVGRAAPSPRPLHVSKVGSIAESSLVHSSVSTLDTPRWPGFRMLLADVWRERGFGDFWGYGLVAEGAAEAMVEAGMHSWDLAAASVVVEEAGGRLTDLNGVRTIQADTCLASNGLLHDELLRAMAG